MMKSGRNPQLDKDLIKFLVKSVQRKPYSSTLESLLKYTMRLDDKVCNYMGHSKSDLRTFLSLFTNELFVDESERVFLIGKDGNPQLGESKSNNIEKTDKIDRAQPDKPISQATGSIYRILGKYGFIELHPPHVGKVYFDGRHVEDGRHMFLIDYGYKEGMRVQIDAIPGPENAEASYRAKHVRCLSSSEYSSSDGGSLKSEAVNIMVDKVGKIAQVFDQYGFIGRTANKVDDVFFFMNTIVMPEGKQITCPLVDILSPGMEAKFDARPNHRQDAQNSWYATRVWIHGVSDKGDPTTEEHKHLNGPIDALDELNEQDVYVSDEEENSEFNLEDLPSIISSEKGYLNAIDDFKGIILFGRSWKYEAAYISDVVRVDGRKVDDQAWRFEGGHDVYFNAQVMDVKNEFGMSEKKIIATLVWIGVEPAMDNLPLKDLYLLYAERHKFTYDHYQYNNNVHMDNDKMKQTTLPEMDLLDEFIAGNFPTPYDDDSIDKFTVGGNRSNGLMLPNGTKDQWPKYEPNHDNEVSSSLLQPLSSSHPQPYPLDFGGGWTSLFGPSHDQMKCWKNTATINEGIASLNLVNTSSQTVQTKGAPILSSATSQTTKPVIAHDSTQTSKVRTKDKPSSTIDLINTKNVSSQTDEGSHSSGKKTSSSACQTEISFKISVNEWNKKCKSSDKDNDVVVQLCPKCHHVYKQ